jgi:hypothetical protein
MLNEMTPRRMNHHVTVGENGTHAQRWAPHSLTSRMPKKQEAKQKLRAATGRGAESQELYTVRRTSRCANIARSVKPSAAPSATSTTARKVCLPLPPSITVWRIVVPTDIFLRFPIATYTERRPGREELHSSDSPSAAIRQEQCIHPLHLRFLPLYFFCQHLLLRRRRRGHLARLPLPRQRSRQCQTATHMELYSEALFATIECLKC